ncbi:MAG: hypothetical protein IJC24_07355 [Clostridia bacterium]|nr:hypothetical protein [Clostridia bacterium]
MKSIKGKWYITVFAAVMSFAAGAATKLSGGYMDEALAAMGEAEGVALLGLSITGMLFNVMLFCWCSMVYGKAGKAMSFFALWIKAFFIGLYCKELTIGFSAIKAILMVLCIFGGACICASFMMEREDKKDKAKQLAIWLSGIAVEGIIMPSVARTWALLFN